MIYTGTDTETALIAPGRKAPPIACMTVCIKGERPKIYDQYVSAIVLERMLRDDNITIVIHNAKFDMGVFMENYPWLTPLIFEKHEKGLIRCTLVNRIMDVIKRGVFQEYDRTGKLRLALGDLVLDSLGEDVEGKKGDTWRFKYRELIDRPLEDWPEEALTYAKRDAWYHIRVFHAYGMEEPLPDELNQVKYAFALQLMYSYGFRADKDRVDTLEKRLLKRVTTWGSRLADLDPPLCTWLEKEDRYKDNQKPQREEHVRQCERHDMTVPRTEPTPKMKEKGITEGNVQLKKDLLVTLPCWGKRLCNFDEDIVCENPLHWVAFIKEDKGELSKYVKWLKLAVDTPVNSKVSTCRATGRIAVSQPPTQQFPRRPGCRECIIPRDGYHFVGADYSANEMVTLAQVLLSTFGRSHMAELLQQGVKIHDYVAAHFLNINYETFLDRKKNGTEEQQKECKNWRQMTKAENFGFPGGMGAAKFVTYAWDSWGVRIDEVTAKEHKKWWMELFPEVKKYHQLIGDRCAQGGGKFRVRQPVSGRLRGGVGFCDGCNTYFQGLAADMTKNALWWVTKECYTGDYMHSRPDGGLFWDGSWAETPLYGCKPVLFMHDEIILEAPIPEAAAAAERLAFLMDESSKLYCPDVPGKAEPWITDAWYKEAETVRNSDGELILWTP